MIDAHNGAHYVAHDQARRHLELLDARKSVCACGPNVKEHHWFTQFQRPLQQTEQYNMSSLA